MIIRKRDTVLTPKPSSVPQPSTASLIWSPTRRHAPTLWGVSGGDGRQRSPASHTNTTKTLHTTCTTVSSQMSVFLSLPSHASLTHSCWHFVHTTLNTAQFYLCFRSLFFLFFYFFLSLLLICDFFFPISFIILPFFLCGVPDLSTIFSLFNAFSFLF